VATSKPSTKDTKTATTAGTSLPAANSPTADPLDPIVLNRILPLVRALRGYTRLKVEGLENIPKGPAILAANHTGWLGLDYALTAVVVHDEKGRTPRGMAHQAWFMNGAVADFATKVGLSKVSKESMAQQVAAGHLVMVFPEGEHGAFRPASGYKVLEFARGFVRVAYETGVPIVPVAILGGEEANPVDRTIEGYSDLLKMPIPVPKNLFPKPVKWMIRFLPPVDAKALGVKAVDDHDSVHAASAAVREQVQQALDDMREERGDPYR
jgi:1-acyl-sn-glycerol-3-phosphate acyltransferase